MKKYFVLLALAALAALASCKSGPGTIPAAGDGERAQTEEWMEQVPAFDDEETFPSWSFETNSGLIKDPAVVAVVGAKEISREEFFKRLDFLCHDDALNMLIQQTLWEQSARAAGIEISEDDVRLYARKGVEQQMEIERENISQRFGASLSYEEYIKQRTGKSLKEYSDELVDGAVKSGMARPGLLRARLVAYDALTSARVRIRHIECPSEERAKEALASIKSGRETFEGKVATDSEDVKSRDNGGMLDPFEEGDWEFREDIKRLGAEFCKAAWAAPTGLQPNPLKSEAGWHVVEVIQKQAARKAAYADLRADIDSFIEKGIARNDLDKWMERAAFRAKIDRSGAGGAAATVNGEKITPSALQKFMTAAFGMEVAQSMVVSEIVSQKKTALGLTNTADEIREMAKKLVEEFKEMQLQRVLYVFPEYRLLQDPLGEYVRRQYNKPLEQYTNELVDLKIKDGTAELELTGAKISAYYLLTTEHVTVQHLMLKTVHEAKAAWYKLEAGADFNLLVEDKKKSILVAAPEESGGELLPFNRAEYPYRDDVNRYGRAFLEVSYATPKGKHSRAFKSKLGWHIVMALDKWPSSSAGIEELKDKINEEIFKREDQRWLAYRLVWVRLEAEKLKAAIKLPDSFE